MNDYQLQAIDFLVKTGTDFKCAFLYNGKHFDDDKETRDIYQITLTRGQRSYSFKFGQSIADSGFYYTKGVQKIDIPREKIGSKNLVSYIKSRDYSFLNNGKSDKIHIPKEPTAYDVLACLTKYDPSTFDDFCSEFGYDTDSRKADATYKAVKEEYISLCALFSSDEMDQLSEIQ